MRRVASFAIVGALQIIAPGIISAQVGTLRALRFSETTNLRAEAPVTGEVFWGAHLGDVSAPADLRAVRLAIPPGNLPLLCVRVETQDGRYWGEAAYPLSGAARGSLQGIAFPTRYVADLFRYERRDIGIRAFAAPSCEESGDAERVYVAVHWADAQPTAPRNRYLLLVNARDPRVDVRFYLPETRQYFACDPDDSSRVKLVFDTECTLDAPAGTTVINMIRRRMNEESTSPLTIYFR